MPRRHASAMACDGVTSRAPGRRFEPHEGGLDEGLDRIVTQVRSCKPRDVYYAAQ